MVCSWCKASMKSTGTHPGGDCLKTMVAEHVFGDFRWIIVKYSESVTALRNSAPPRNFGQVNCCEIKWSGNCIAQRSATQGFGVLCAFGYSQSTCKNVKQNGPNCNWNDVKSHMWNKMVPYDGRRRHMIESSYHGVDLLFYAWFQWQAAPNRDRDSEEREPEERE